MYYNDLAGFILRITESKPLTEEIVQDVFLKIWLNRETLPDVNSFRAFLFTVAKNHAFNCLKKIARERIREKEWTESVLREATSDQAMADTPDTNHLVEAAVSLLPPQQQKVYILSRTHRMRHTEIAAELNISLETVKKHMVLALRFLKNHLLTQMRMVILAVTSLL